MMDQVKKLFESGKLVHPWESNSQYGSLVDFFHAVALFSNNTLKEEPSVHSKRYLKELEGVQHLVVVILDGFGMHLVNKQSETSIYRRNLVEEMKTVFPSSTPCAKTTIVTGKPVGQHGIVGWNIYLEDLDRIVEILLSREKTTKLPLNQVQGWDPKNYFKTPCPYIVGQTRAEKVTSFQPALFNVAPTNSWCLTHFQKENIDWYQTIEEVPEKLGKIFESQKSSTSYIYWPDIDHLQHVNKTGAPEVAKSIERITKVLEQIEVLIKKCPQSTKMFITADHGLIDIDPIIHLTPNDEMFQKFPDLKWSGETRSPFFHVNTAASRQDFPAYFHARFGNYFTLLTADQVEELHLLGIEKMAPETKSRIGTWIAFPIADATLCPDKGPDHPPHVASHGGFAKDEIMIPLICVSNTDPHSNKN